MEKNCLLRNLNGAVNNQKLPYYVDDIDYSSLANNISYEIGKYWKDIQEQQASAGIDSFAAIAPITLTTRNGIFVSSKNPSYRVEKLSAKISGVYSKYMSDGQFYAYKGAVDYNGEITIYITIRTVDDSSIPSGLDFEDILEIKSEVNPYINNGLIIATAICADATEASTWYANSSSYDYAILNYASVGYKLHRKYGSNEVTRDIDADREKTVLVNGKYYRYNGSLYVEI